MVRGRQLRTCGRFGITPSASLWQICPQHQKYVDIRIHRLPFIDIVFDPTRRDRFAAMRRRVAAVIKKHPNLGHRAVAKRAKAPRSTAWRIMERLRQGRPM